MDEAAARSWLAEQAGVSRETIAALDRFVALLVAANLSQNLISAASIATIWSRHIVDSAQLAFIIEPDCAKKEERRSWVDLGSGPGLPGIVLAILRPDDNFTLVESRALRCAFLSDAVAFLGLTNVMVRRSKAEQLRAKFDVIVARAFAPLAKTIIIARPRAHDETLWLLPKGKNGVNELAELPRAWQNAFHVKRSVTDPQSTILVGCGIYAGKSA